jgi:hypothetical protein
VRFAQDDRFVVGKVKAIAKEEAGPFDSADVRFAQDDRSFFDMNFRDRTLVLFVLAGP